MTSAVVTENKSPKLLSEVLTYRNDRLISEIARIQRISLHDASNNLQDLFKWLWINAIQLALFEKGEKVPSDLIIGHELKFIDDMWHVFLMFTKDYRDFCYLYLGRMIHHDPIAQEEKESFRKLRGESPVAALEKRRKEIRPQLEFILQHLGESTLSAWYLKK